MSSHPTTLTISGSGFTESEAAEARRVLMEGLKATMTARRRSSVGQMEYVEVPDYPTRAVYARIVLEQAKGKPVATSVNLNANAPKAPENEEDFIRSCLADPEKGRELIEVAEKVLAQARKSIPVEIVVSPSLPEEPKKASDSQS